MSSADAVRKPKRVLMSVSDKTGLIELAKELSRQGCEILASGGTLKALEEQGIHARKVEGFSGNPEAFQGRMKTLSFRIFSGILARRNDVSDLQDRESLNIPEIDVVVVNFYPFEKAAQGISRSELTELIDIGGPALVRAAAKNSPDVLVLTDPAQYGDVTEELCRLGGFTAATARRASARAWERVLEYDRAISAEFGESRRVPLKYGENPHQEAYFQMDPGSPIRFDEPLTPNAISYNNILDVSGAYRVLRDAQAACPDSAVVTIVKHNNPCGVAAVPLSRPQALAEALALAWAGDPISAFGGVLAFSHPIDEAVADFLQDKFVECVVAPEMTKDTPALKRLISRRKGLKALPLRPASGTPAGFRAVQVEGGTLHQKPDIYQPEELRPVAGETWSDSKQKLARFGIALGKNVRSNSIVLVGEKDGSLILLGAGQGQPNRIDALRILAVPRAKETCARIGANFSEAVLISDAFFPFPDSVEACAEAGIRFVVEPGGSIKDADVIQAAKDRGIRMAFTGVRHFLH